jgi:hypothetical protein
MRKLVFALLLVTLAIPAFADDALVLPKGIIRTTVVPSFGYTVPQSYHGEGGYNTLENDLRAINLGLAVEYGVIDWVNLAVQWAPGVNVLSQVGRGSKTVDQWRDIFIGAKAQIIGPRAPVANDRIRLAAATGVKVPLSPIDWYAQYDEFDLATQSPTVEDDAAVIHTDRHTTGFGARGYFDYIFSEMFFVNLYTEYIYYPFLGPAPNLTTAITYAVDEYGGGVQLATDKFMSSGDDDLESKHFKDLYAYGWDFTFEVDPQFETTLPDNPTRIGANMPLTYKYAPAIYYDGEKIPDTESHLWYVEPTVSIWPNLPIPMQVKLGYRIPFAGVNASGSHAVVLRIRNFIRVHD